MGEIFLPPQPEPKKLEVAPNLHVTTEKGPQVAAFARSSCPRPAMRSGCVDILNMYMLTG